MRSSIKGWSPRLGSISKGKRESGRAYTRGFVVLIDRFGMVWGWGVWVLRGKIVSGGLSFLHRMDKHGDTFFNFA